MRISLEQRRKAGLKMLELIIKSLGYMILMDYYKKIEISENL